MIIQANGFSNWEWSTNKNHVTGKMVDKYSLEYSALSRLFPPTNTVTKSACAGARLSLLTRRCADLNDAPSELSELRCPDRLELLDELTLGWVFFWRKNLTQNTIWSSPPSRWWLTVNRQRPSAVWFWLMWPLVKNNRVSFFRGGFDAHSSY